MQLGESFPWHCSCGPVEARRARVTVTLSLGAYVPSHDPVPTAVD